MRNRKSHTRRWTWTVIAAIFLGLASVSVLSVLANGSGLTDPACHPAVATPLSPDLNSAARDGNVASIYYCADAGYLGFDFSQPTDVSSVEVYQLYGYNGGTEPSSLRVELSLDGLSWTLVGGVSPHTPLQLSSPVTARYIRLVKVGAGGWGVSEVYVNDTLMSSVVTPTPTPTPTGIEGGFTPTCVYNLDARWSNPPYYASDGNASTLYYCYGYDGVQFDYGIGKVIYISSVSVESVIGFAGDGAPSYVRVYASPNGVDFDYIGSATMTTPLTLSTPITARAIRIGRGYDGSPGGWWGLGDSKINGYIFRNVPTFPTPATPQPNGAFWESFATGESSYGMDVLRKASDGIVASYSRHDNWSSIIYRFYSSTVTVTSASVGVTTGYAGDGAPVSMTFSTSMDGVTWSSPVTINANSTVSITPVNARYVQFARDGWRQGYAWWGVSELGVNGVKLPDVPLPTENKWFLGDNVLSGTWTTSSSLLLNNGVTYTIPSTAQVVGWITQFSTSGGDSYVLYPDGGFAVWNTPIAWYHVTDNTVCTVNDNAFYRNGYPPETWSQVCDIAYNMAGVGSGGLSSSNNTGNTRARAQGSGVWDYGGLTLGSWNHDGAGFTITYMRPILRGIPPTPQPATATATPLPATATATPLPPTATNTPTATPLSATSTPTFTATPLPPTATNTATATPQPATATPTPTSQPTFTATATNTPLAPTQTAQAAMTATQSAVTITINSGSLYVNANPITFPNTVLSGAAQTVNGSTTAWDVGDNTGIGAGYRLTIAATDFSDGAGHTISVSNVSVQVLDTDIALQAGNTKPVSALAAYTPLSTIAQNLLTANINTGMGTYTALPSFRVIIPASAYAGSYTSTVTVTIIAGAP